MTGGRITGGKRPAQEAFGEASTQPPAPRQRSAAPGLPRPPGMPIMPGPGPSNRGPIAPRQLQALDQAIGRVDRFAEEAPPDAADLPALDGWRAHAADVRLQLARALSSIDHTDALPPEAANQGSAKLLDACLIIRDVAARRGLPQADEYLLTALLLKVQHQARGVLHNGLPAADVIPMEFVPSDGASAGATHLAIRGSSIRAVKVSTTARADTGQSWGTVVHESTHEAQASREPPPGHPREGHLAAARHLPHWRPGTKPIPEQGHPAHSSFYKSTPKETQAFLEEAHVAVQMSHRARRKSGGRLAGVVDAIIPRLIDTSRRLHKPADPAASASSGGAPAEPLHYDATAHAQYAELAGLLNALADLDIAANSLGWSQSYGAGVEAAIRAALDSPSALLTRGTEAETGLLVQLFEQAISLVKSGGEVQMGALDVRAPTMRELLGLKSNPVTYAGHRLGVPAAVVQSALGSAVDRSGFVADVTAMHAQIGVGAAAAEQAEAQIAAAVGHLAAALLGIDERTFPVLAVNLYEAPRQTLPLIEGLNLHAGQRRKMTFEANTWQLHIPAHELASLERAAPRLAKMAFDAAYVADVQRLSIVRRPVTAHDPGDFSRNILTTLVATERPFPPVGVNTAAAAVLRRASARHPSPLGPSHAGSLFHEGRRSELKASGSESLEYLTNTAIRWSNPGVALRRALGAIVSQEFAPVAPQAAR